MNTKRSKGIIGITLAIIMIASIFAAIAPSTTAVGPLSEFATAKHTIDAGGNVDDSLAYSVGDTIHYNITFTNTDPNYECTLDLWDILPNGTRVDFADDYHFMVGEKVSYDYYYVVNVLDVKDPVGIFPYKHVFNIAYAQGLNNVSDPIDDSKGKYSRILEEELPVFVFDVEHICCHNMSFDGSASFDPDGYIQNHSWKIDGVEVSSAETAPGVITHNFTPVCGFHTVELSGYDNRSNYNTTGAVTIDVPCPPTAVCEADPDHVYRGQGTTVTFDGSGSTADTGSGMSIVSYLWEFWDATTSTQATFDKVVDDPTADELCANLTVSDGHCTDTRQVCVDIWEKTNCTLRVYGRLNEGAGDPTVTDLWGGNELKPENPPYTDAMAPFYPQAPESPRKDFLTFDPVMMYHNDIDWDNDGFDDSVYMRSIRNDGNDASEKIFKRMWYEPTEWYKDEDGDGELDLLLQSGGTITAAEAMLCENFPADIVPFNIDDTKADIYAPSIKQEFTFMLLDNSTCPEPLAAPTGSSSMLIPMATWESSDTGSSNGDNGIDSFDVDGKTTGPTAGPNRVLIESEYSLGVDLDNDDRGVANPLYPGAGNLEQLDTDLDDLSGDETLVLTSDWMLIEVGDELQFFDHKIELWDVFGEQPVGPEAIFLVYYQGDTSPYGQLRSWPSIAGGEIKYFEQGFENTKAVGEAGVQGPFFVMVDTVSGDEDKALVKVGRVFGNTYANIGANPYWNQKQFYVDKVCYNVVAIKADGNESLKYVTFRQKLPKVPIKIPNHTQHLKGWDIDEVLPEMPQYNMPHAIVKDVQETWTTPTEICDKIGEYVGPTYHDGVPALVIVYNDETIEPRFHGELKELLYEEQEGSEHWMIEHIQTLPWEYTLFTLPPEDNAGIYLLTSAFYADEALNVTWDGEENPIAIDKGQRLKFWYRDCSGPYFVDWDGALRVYGRLARGAGDPMAGYGGPYPENPAYTDPMAPFWPQASEAPDKDFVTFNPIMMYHNDNDWDNDGVEDAVYAQKIRRNFMDASEKIFKRMWYEPTEWYKDEDGDGELDLALSDGTTITASSLENPTVLYDLMTSDVTIVPANTPESDYPYTEAADLYAPSIKQEFTFMMLDNSVCPEPAAGRTSGGTSMLIPMATWEDDNGIDSFDANGDDVPDRVIIDSEAAMILRNVVPPDFGDNDGILEDLDNNGVAMSGDETLILHLDRMTLSLPGSVPDYGDTLQFFDHKLVLTDVTGSDLNPLAYFDLYYQADPASNAITQTPMSWPTFGIGEVKYFKQGLDNTRVPGASGEQGPFFVIVTNVDKQENKVTLIVGRMFGETRANIGTNPYWNQKQFYVDGVCYNVVAIMTEGSLDFKYVTFRQKLPKVPVKIPNHTQHLIGWRADTVLPEMPQYNMNHTILLDIQKEWTDPDDVCDKLGAPMEAPALEITWARETTEPRFHGELKEIYYEYGGNETWMIEWFQTIPYEYTAFDLPLGHGLYLLTSAFGAPEACAYYHDLGEPIILPGDARLKFWYDPAVPTDIYVTRPPTITTPTIDEYYDRATNGGNANGQVDAAEIQKAWSDYVFAMGTGRYPFGEGGIYTAADLMWMIAQFL